MAELRKLGAELRPGDTIAVFWSPGRDTIMSLRPYEGPLVAIFTKQPPGAQLAQFALNKVGMTIENGDIFTVYVHD